MALTWNESAGRFVDARGRFVSEQAVRRVVDQIADGASERMAGLSRQMLAGDLSLAEWQAGCMRTAKLATVATGTIAGGGAAQMSFSDYGYLGRLLRDDYDRLRTFAQQIADGTQPLDGRLIARSRMYGQQSRIVYERVRARDAASRGMGEERNILHAGESCQSCRDQSARGWVTLGSLIPCGQRTCLSNCKCSISRRSSVEVAA